jgi:hypothetical protein
MKQVQEHTESEDHVDHCTANEGTKNDHVLLGDAFRCPRTVVIQAHKADTAVIAVGNFVPLDDRAFMAEIVPT